MSLQISRKSQPGWRHGECDYYDILPASWIPKYGWREHVEPGAIARATPDCRNQILQWGWICPAILLLFMGDVAYS